MDEVGGGGNKGKGESETSPGFLQSSWVGMRMLDP